MPSRDGVWYGPQDGQFKMWYMAGVNRLLCLATSGDGLRWTKATLDVVLRTIIVSRFGRDFSTVWLDLDERVRKRRYKMFLYQRPEDSGELSLFFSGDGIHWMRSRGQERPDDGSLHGPLENPFRKVCVFSIKATTRREFGVGDSIANIVTSSRDAVVSRRAAHVGRHRPADRERPEYGLHPKLYDLDAAAYESILLGLFVICRGEGLRPGGNPSDLDRVQPRSFRGVESLAVLLSEFAGSRGRYYMPGMATHVPR